MPDDHTLDAESFAKAVQHAEAANDPEVIARLFARDAKLEAPVREQSSEKESDATAFWKHYLDAFQSIRSDFTHVQSVGNTGVLEWESTGKLKTGKPIQYKGVSIVEFAGGKVKRFATYYDSAAFTTEDNKHSDK